MSSDPERYARAVHNTALIAFIACPILALLPPRKLDFYTLGLVGVTGYSANHLLRESSGRSAWQYVSGQQSQPQPRRPEQSPADLATQPSVVAELQREARAEGARASWKTQRRREILEDVEEGKGFGDMIVDQIWEVWNQGKTEDEEREG